MAELKDILKTPQNEISDLYVDTKEVLPNILDTDGKVVTTDVGGFKAGDVISGDRFTGELLEHLLFPYIAQSMKSLSINPGSNVEVGKAIIVANANLSWTNDSEGHVPYNVVISGAGFSGEQTLPPGSTTAIINAIPNTSLMRTNVGEELWNVTAKDKDGNSINNSSDRVYWYYPIFYGMSATNLINNGTLLYTTLDKDISSKSNKNYTISGTSEYIYFVCHSSFGELSQIKDGSGFVQDFADWDIVPMDVSSSGLDYNWTQQYKLYKSKAKVSVSNQTYQFIF
jgi:hypothetical protein